MLVIRDTICWSTLCIKLYIKRIKSIYINFYKVEGDEKMEIIKSQSQNSISYHVISMWYEFFIEEVVLGHIVVVA